MSDKPSNPRMVSVPTFTCKNCGRIWGPWKNWKPPMTQPSDEMVDELLSRFGLVLTDDPEFDHNEQTFTKAKADFFAAIAATGLVEENARLKALGDRLAGALSNNRALARKRQAICGLDGTMAAIEGFANNALAAWENKDAIASGAHDQG